jgi:PAS domain S-box-containing protein
MLAGILVLVAFHSFSNVLEWTGVTTTLGVIEDFAVLLSPILWGSLFYAILRRSAEQDLQESAESLRRERDLVARLMETSPAGIVRVDGQGLITFANASAERVLGFTRDEIAQRSYNAPTWRITDYDGRPFPDEELPFRRVMDTGQPVFDVRHAIEWPDGRRVLLSINAAPLLDEMRQVEGMVATVEDITSRVRAREALAESEEKYRLVSENVPVAVYSALPDEHSTNVFMSGRVAELTGYSGQQFLEDAQLWSQILHPDDREYVWQKVDEHRKQKTPLDVEYRIITKDGAVKWLRDKAIPLLGKDGQIVRINGFMEDVTARRQAEAALQQYIERLSTLRAIDGVILAARSPEEVAQAALLHVGRLVACRRANVTVFDLKAYKAKILAVYPDDGTELGAGASIRLELFGDIVDTLQQGKVYVIDDILDFSDPPPVVQARQAAGVRSFACVPLIVQSELIGALSLCANTPGLFMAEEIEIAGEAANQMAIAIQQARLHAQVQRHADDLEQQIEVRTRDLERRTAQLQVAAEVARDATTAHSLDSLLNRAVNLIRERFGFYHAGIFMVDDRNEFALLKAATGEAGRQMLEHGHRLKVGEVGIVGHVTGTGQPRIVLDTEGDAVYFDNPFLPDTRSEMALPMRVGDAVIGALDVQSPEEAAFDEEDVEILQVMADQLAVAIERTRLFERTQATLEERLRTVIANAPIVLAALDRDGVFTLSEGKGLAALGVKPGEHVGQSIFDVYRDQPDVLAYVRRALGGESVGPVIKISEMVFDSWYSPVRDESGEISGVIGVATDITERKRAEEALRESEERMWRQERMAAIGQLAGGIAHDFNNFLTTITLYAQILLRKPHLPTDLKPNLETILEEARQATKLVRQVLDFSRRSMMETQPVDLVVFIEESVAILRRALPESIHLLIEVGRDECVVDADPTRIQQVVMNLALNARDAMPHGGELCIGLSQMQVGAETSRGKALPVDMPDGDWVCLSVSDTGTGMTDEVQSHLFEPFFTTKKPGQGTGLGLAQVYGIVKQHKGHIGFDTQMGQGTTFQVYFPVHGKRAGRQETIENPPAPEGKGEVILLVEDEEKVRKVGQDLLESLGYRVLVAGNGKEALDIYRATERVDLVLTDLVMPEMGGVDLVHELRKAGSPVKVLAITGYAMAEDMKKLRAEEILDIVHKPFEVYTLAEAVRRFLDADTD